MAAVEDLVVKDAIEDEEADIPDDVKEAAQVVAVWGVKSIISCIKKSKKNKPKQRAVDK